MKNSTECFISNTFLCLCLKLHHESSTFSILRPLVVMIWYILIFFNFYLLSFVYRMWVYKCVTVPEDNFVTSVSSFLLYLSSGTQTQIFRLKEQVLYLLSHPVGPMCYTFEGTLVTLYFETAGKWLPFDWASVDHFRSLSWLFTRNVVKSKLNYLSLCPLFIKQE